MENLLTKIGTVNVPKKLARLILIAMIGYSLFYPKDMATVLLIASGCFYYFLCGKNVKAKIICFFISIVLITTVSRIVDAVVKIAFVATIAVTLFQKNVLQQKKES